MTVTIAMLAADPELGIVEVIGDDGLCLAQVASLDRAVSGSLTFANSSSRLRGLPHDASGFALFWPRLERVSDIPAGATALLCDNPRLAFMRAVQRYFPPALPVPGVHPTACVDPSAVIDPSAHVGAYCVIGAGCTIGAGTVIHPHVTLYSGVKIGRYCRVNSGTVIGADGFGYERNDAGELEKFPHIGGVLIADNVEIGSNTSIDRGTLGHTVIHARVRIDNLVHVSHNVEIGEDTAVIALSMLGGSVRIGSGAWIAPGAVLMNQVGVGEGATVGLGAVVVKNVSDGQTVMGAPAQDSAEFRATRKALSQLLKD